MKTLTVALPGREYNIQIGWGLLTWAGEELRAVLPGASRIFVVTDSHVAPLYLERVRASLEGAGFQVTAHTVPAGESSKCAARLAELWEAMMAAGLTRTDAVAALGGGVVGDLAGFAAATILRGVDFVQIPTTLLAQVDSSVGGKVAVDLEHGKNLAGPSGSPGWCSWTRRCWTLCRCLSSWRAWRRWSNTAASRTRPFSTSWRPALPGGADGGNGTHPVYLLRD